MNYKIGKKYRIGGTQGLVSVLLEIHDDGLLVLETEDGFCHSEFYIGDCHLYPFQEYEQLSLFEL